MLLTSNYGLNKPEGTDPVDVQDFNENADIIDAELKKRPTTDGEASDMTVEFTEATQLAELTSNDSLKGLFGKLKLAVKKVIEMSQEMTTLKKSVSDGKTAVASAITGQGVSTAADATFDTMATNIEAIKTSEGTARVAQVLAGYTFTNDNGGPWNGTMTNRGAWTGATTGSGNVAIPAGYHNGSGYVSGAGAYSAGVTAADARVNTASASYSAGVNAGKAQLPNITTVYNCVTSDAGNNQTHDLYIYIPSGYNYLTLTASASMSYNCQISFGAYGNGATALSSGNGTTSFSKESTKIYVGGYSYVMLRMSTPAAKGTVNMSSVLSVA